jgi:hypothetical protein
MRIALLPEQIIDLHNEYLELLDKLTILMDQQVSGVNEIQARTIQRQARRMRARMTSIETMLANNYKED